MAEIEIGKVTHYFGHINVAAVQIANGTLTVGDTIHIKGHTSDVTTRVDSMQVNHVDVREARVGDAVGLRVPAHVREHDQVFKVIP
jgi:putative protease